MDKQDPRYLRGARSFVQGRFETLAREAFDDGWTPEEPPNGEMRRSLKTVVAIESARSIISRNDSPDVPFSQSINPYRGCEHGCVYCYARPSHAYLELSPGLDFETKLFAKTNAVELLRQELAKPGYRPSPIALGANTDCYQPIERGQRITRGILEVMAEGRRHRRVLGGGMRQAGIIAAGALYALEHHVGRLAEDHATAQRLADAIRAIDCLRLEPPQVVRGPSTPDVRQLDAGGTLARAERGAREVGYRAL